MFGTNEIDQMMLLVTIARRISETDEMDQMMLPVTKLKVSWMRF